jgi:3-dehydroquinate synthetase
VVGGGAGDDVGGFVASTYMRGLPLGVVPTSLEGMVDTSIGGKTALNHRRARNLIGTFHHPRLTWSDVSLLQDEPSRQRRAGLAEVVKYAMLEGSLALDESPGVTLLERLERGAEALAGLERQTLVQVVARCVALKAQVVAADERDLGRHRILLDYGHTVGHALEAASGHSLLHGEAVAVGMAVEARLAVRLRVADPALEARQDALLERLGLPTRLPRVSRELLLEHVDRAALQILQAQVERLPTSQGRVTVSRAVPEEEVAAALAERS